MKDIHSLERIVPDEMNNAVQWSAETLELHMERYRFASSHIKGGAVLDMACGVGYGAYLLAGSAAVESITAVDIDADCIAYARQRYNHPRISFLQADATRFDDGRKFDSIVSLETIEHLPDTQLFLTHLYQLLISNGLLICSVPVTPSVDANPYHLHDFTEKQFLRLLIKAGFSIEEKMIQVQPFSPVQVLDKKEKRTESLRKNLPFYYLSHPMALIKRIVSTMRYGFTNRYLVVCCRKK
ncbi:class I SAM-dependent methyltransferase [Lacibacter sediminis]|uniref:Class I SAM-dependent methyltransferase n=1 Tax=Lacibacter sediminis TaxID=2760713 RepID=A0A7G5XIQ6_9BACT|nr:class I SAM-dependent methyltransferase [Lacibacter sediminis]QNA45359.1 class I SAM-dependent methyltransferase [Lacibacter sediminis]